VLCQVGVDIQSKEEKLKNLAIVIGFSVLGLGLAAASFTVDPFQ
jgi:hypothetical protein